MVTNKKWLQMFEEKEGDHWKAKDKCRAVWSEDGEAYDCEILRIRTDCFGQRVAKVCFTEYGDEADILVAELLKCLPTKSKRGSASAKSDQQRTSFTSASRSSTKRSSRDADADDERRGIGTRPTSCGTMGHDQGEGIDSADDDDDDDDDDEGNKPTVPVNPTSPYVPLVLGQMADGKDAVIPARLNQYLYDFQREGIQFLFDHYKENRGAILTDDMGLGKTIQTIALLYAVQHKTGRYKDDKMPDTVRRVMKKQITRRPVLITTPASICAQFKAEIETWGYFEVYHVNGTTHTVQQVEQLIGHNALDIVLCSHDNLASNVEFYNTINWDMIVVDELHKIKTLTSARRKAFDQLLCVRRFGLTGTLVQNHLGELYSLVSWVYDRLKNPLGTKDEWARLEDEVKKGLSRMGSAEEVRKKNEHEASIQLKMMKISLGRFKKDFPKIFRAQKRERVVYCKMGNQQQEMYRRIIENPVVKSVIRKKKPCHCGSGTLAGKCCELWTKQEKKFFGWMSLIEMLLLHPALASEEPKNRKQDEHNTATQADRDIVVFGRELPETCKRWEVAKTFESAKLRTLLVMLENLKKKKDYKVLVFCHSVGMLDIVQDAIQNSYGYCRIDGKLNAKARAKMVHSFYNDEDKFLFLISKTAGGTGLNLVAANVVIILDPEWNPATDAQAADRAYRMGQTRDVLVYKFVTKDSYDEIKYARQGYKNEQAAIALGGENSKKGVGRYEAVQGDQAREGELFGLANMLDHTLLVDLNKTIMERCARVDSEKGLDEDGYEVYEELKPVDGGDDKSYSNEEEIEDFDEDDEVDSLSDPKVQELPDGYEVDTAIVDLQTGKLSEAQKHDAELAELLLDENAVEYTGVPRAKRHKSGDGKTVKVLYNKETKTRQYQLPNTDYVIRRGGQPSQMTRDLLEKIAGTKRKDIMTFMMEIKDMSDKEIEQMVDEHYGESFEAMLARKIKWDSEQGHAAHDPP